MSHKTKIVTARVSNEIAERLEQMAEGKTRSEVIEKAIQTYSDISTLCIWCDIEPSELIEKLEKMFVDGDFLIIDGEIKCKRVQ